MDSSTLTLYTKNFYFLVLKFSVYLNRRVFVMAFSEGTDLSARSDQNLHWEHFG